MLITIPGFKIKIFIAKICIIGKFELLKPATGDKSDCLAYKVSLKEDPTEDKLGAVADDNATEAYW